MPVGKLCAAGAAFILLVAAPVAGETLRFSARGDIGSLDPYGLNETFTLGYLGNIYEGLVARGPDLALVPGLAERWEIVEPTRWRFHLRKGVKFQNGDAFDADDVLFSATRAREAGSDLKARLAGVVQVVKVDDSTVDFVTETPNPILNAEWDTWYIMDREWALAHGAQHPTRTGDPTGTYADMHANGTGPFAVTGREVDVRTTARRFDGWWGERTDNLDEVVFEPIKTNSTRVAALLSGELDVILSVPVQDVRRIESNPGTHVLSGPELRTIFLGLDQSRDELLYATVKGKNPFKDRRVRLAFYQAIDIEAIKAKIMRGQSTPTAAMVAPGVEGYPKDLQRYPYDPAASRRLLAEAGYPDGFGVTLDCPTDRYVNDESICVAIVGMLARIGIKVRLEAKPKALYFGKVLAQGGYDTSFYLLGWTPTSNDSWSTLFNIVQTRDPASGAGAFNLGGYSSPAIDALSGRIMGETDLAERRALIDQAWQLLHDDVGYLPLHQQALAWGVRDGVTLVQRPDDQFLWRWVRIER